MSGRRVRISGSLSATHCRVVAPIKTASPSSRMYDKALMRLMSISLVGRASRIAIIGTSVWPPAITRALSSPAMSAQASSTLSARQ
jgi:hypothetical protein